MKKEDLEKIKDIIRKNGASHCLCGHGEWCSACDGTDARRIEKICNALDKEFTEN